MSIKNFSPLLHSFQTHFFRLFFLFLGSSFSLSAKIFDFFRLLFFRSLCRLMKNLQLEQIPPYYEILMKVVNFTASLNLQYFFTFGLGSNIWEENLSESILSFFLLGF
ncbi:hypothetical protein ES319_D09G059700v1 [Gossypium barbadense]|uniref:Uncharacterized protein n=1 Tax=Gossypium barbadense TaxID=3634 RepID=A0A5J5Q1J2_GOSBA|nr:hypothetical protein ES319_D09G059700v1 [Gossypium barbadense]KAB2012028.1 hypothetical protein ES319_D09G059700v1 [Gossypium barbadense]